MPSYEDTPLIDKLQGDSSTQPSSPTPTIQPANPNSRPGFDFFTLNGDGSVPDLIETRPPPGQRTPPAALSSLAVKMADQHLSDSITSLEDGQYDMVDDASELSSEDNETVSIASTDNLASEDDGQMTPEDTDSLADTDDARPMSADTPAVDHTMSPANYRRDGLDSPALADYQYQLILLESQNKMRLLRDRQQCKQEDGQSADKNVYSVEDSLLSEDLETPRQSTIHKLSAPPQVPAPPSSKSDMQRQPTLAGNCFRTFKASCRAGLQYLPYLLLIAALVSLIETVPMTSFWLKPAEDLAARREALSSALAKLTDNPDASRTVNIEHLLPPPTPVSTNIIGQQQLDVRYQGIPPNYVIISLPKAAPRITPQIKQIEVYRGSEKIDFHTTRLLDSIYAVSFDPSEGHGIISVTMLCKSPTMNVTVSHNFGRRLFHYQTYEKVGTDLGKSVNEDIASACQTARSLSQRLQLDFGAGVAATRNVTTQLAVHMNRDLQLWANTAASVFGKAASARNSTANAIRQDIERAQKDLRKVGNDVQKFLGQTSKKLKTSVTDPLVMSRERALQLKDKFLSCKGAIKAKKAGKALSVPSAQAVPKATRKQQKRDERKAKLDKIKARTLARQESQTRAPLSGQQQKKKKKKDNIPPLNAEKIPCKKAIWGKKCSGSGSCAASSACACACGKTRPTQAPEVS